MLLDIFSKQPNEPIFNDVRALPVYQQAWASLVVNGGAYDTVAGRGNVSSTFAIEVMGLTGNDAAQFERLHGKVAGLVFDNTVGAWLERTEWKRRVR